MSVLEELQASVQRAAEAARPSVVGLRRFGSGVVVAPGSVLTSVHVLRGPERTVLFGDGRAEQATVAATDPDWGLAVLSVDTGAAPPVAWADAPPALGAAVFAAADPGGRGLRVGFGLVVAEQGGFHGPRRRRMGAAIEHSAPLPRGAAGSPLLDAGGRLVGVNVFRLEGGLVVALVADAALRARVDALVRGEAPERPTLGLALAPAHVARRLRAAVGLPEREGLLVRGVQEGSPAASAGIERGDLVVAAAGAPTASLDDLLAALDAAQGALELTLVRGADERTVRVELGPPPS